MGSGVAPGVGEGVGVGLAGCGRLLNAEREGTTGAGRAIIVRGVWVASGALLGAGDVLSDGADR